MVNMAFATGIQITLTGEDPRDLSTMSSKAAYSSLILGKDIHTTAYKRWSEAVDSPLMINNETEWTNVCLNPFKTVRETKVQSLQYKIVNRILPCNSYLRQLRIKDSESCDECNDVDTIAHFLFLCPKVQTFWATICEWFENSVDIRMQNLSLKDFVFGIEPSSNRGKIINYILLQTKYFVHRQKLFHQGDLRLLHFLQELKVKLRCEKFISRQEGKTARFKKWEQIFLALG